MLEMFSHSHGRQKMQELIIHNDVIESQNEKKLKHHREDFDCLAQNLNNRGFEIEKLVDLASKYGIAIPSWGTGTGGTRFARYPGKGEPRGIMDKIDDCSVINQLTTCTPSISIHIPWDKPKDPKSLKLHAKRKGLSFDAMNSNSFQDQENQKYSYKFGSLSHTDLNTRKQAIDHNIECIEIGKVLGSKALTVWIGDGSNFPGQSNFKKAFERYIESASEIYSALPQDWLMYLEHKIYEPAFYSTVIQDWGSNYLAAVELGDKAQCLVDLGHHAPTVNIEMIVSRLIQFKKLGGFHFNDSKYGDDDLDSGSINPYQLFLVFSELVQASLEDSEFRPAFMLDQSHNVTDPIESLMVSAIETQRAFIQAHLVDRNFLNFAQESNDALLASEAMKNAFRTDVSPILREARFRANGALEPIKCFRASRYRDQVAEIRPKILSGSSGIV